MFFVNKVLSRTCVLGSIAVLSACGGGGGGGSTASTTTSSTVVSGTASKGLLQNALVTAYCGVQSSTNAIGTASTDSNGNYSLTLTSACAQPVEVVVTAKASGTTMLDEIEGSIAAPSNLALRAFVPSASGTVSQPITPFTDMAAAIVKNSISTNSALTLSSAVVESAKLAIIDNVLGGQSALLTATPLPPSAYSTATTDQQKLIVLLTAISQAAQGAAGATPGEKVQAILTQLADQAKQTVPAVTATGYTVSPSANTTTGATAQNATPLATINSGLTALADPNNTSTLTKLGAATAAIQTSAAIVKTDIVTTSATQIASAQTAGGTVTAPAAKTAIEAAKTLFTAVRTNVLALVTTDPLNPGFLQNQNTELNNDINSQALAGTYHVTDIMMAAHRATTLLAQTNKSLAAVTAGGANVAPAGSVPKTNAFGSFYQRVSSEGTGQMTCNGYYIQGSGLTANDGSVRVSPLANNSGNPTANCGMLIYRGDLQREMQFVVRSPANKPTTGTNTFVYVNRIRTWADPACNSGANPACLYQDSNEVTGTLTATLDASLAVTSMSFVDQPVIPLQGATASSLALNYTASQAGNVTTITMTAGQTSGSLKYNFGSGSQLVITDNATSTPPSNSVVAKLVGQVQTAKFELNGTFNLSGTNTNNTTANGTVGFVGSISTLSGGVATPFLEGTLTGNSVASTVAFSGKVTNGSAVNSISLTGDSSVLGQQRGTVTVLTPGYSFTASGTSYDNVMVPSIMTVTSTADSNKIVATRVNGTSTIDVLNSAGTKIGTLGGNQINFEDGSFIVLN